MRSEQEMVQENNYFSTLTALVDLSAAVRELFEREGEAGFEKRVQLAREMLRDVEVEVDGLVRCSS